VDFNLFFEVGNCARDLQIARSTGLAIDASTSEYLLGISKVRYYNERTALSREGGSMSTNRVQSIEPTEEQKRALELFLTEESLRIDAYAGTGKTATLQLLAQHSPRRGLYLAFNRDIAHEARARFPRHTRCATIHSIAFHAVVSMSRYPDSKLTGKVSANLIAEFLGIPQSITFPFGLTLPRQSYSTVLFDATKRFLQSDDTEPLESHVPLYGTLETIPEAHFEQFKLRALLHLRVVWELMRSESKRFPLGHDGYLKLWALSNPKPQFDYLMVDEAQDLNPVVLGVLSRLPYQVVYVGDPYQQIYDWRGAVNALAKVQTKHHILLSQSFRFGPVIAAAASSVIRHLGASQPLRGAPYIESHLARVRANVILCRTNTGVITNVLRCRDRGIKCFVLGGTRELEQLLEGVAQIKMGIPSHVPELLGFSTWNDVMLFSVEQEGQHLRSLVALVKEYGEATMLSALDSCEKQEKTAQVICSTAHRAKGREWDYVKIDSDFESAFMRRPSQISPDKAQAALEAETRLLYVAMTRARLAVQLPPHLLTQFELEETTTETLGTLKPDVPTIETSVTAAPATNGPLEISTAPPPWKNQAEETDALRRFFW
jgi:superfamily I DNA/RNA helicase